MSKKEYDVIYYIGRFEPAHKAHIKNIEYCLNIADYVVVLVGSCGGPRTMKNPWNFNERVNMIRCNFNKEDQISMGFASIEDHPYNDNAWAAQVNRIIYNDISPFNPIPKNARRAILCPRKDESTYYLKYFSEIEQVEIPIIPGFNATDIRDVYFTNYNSFIDFSADSSITCKTHEYLVDWKNNNTEEYERISREFRIVREYKDAWSVAPYSPTFVTTDVVIVACNHVLLIKRKSAPGEGLYALPGGFLNQNERIVDGAIRELKEETKIKVPEKVLLGSIKAKEVFDAPDRSLRGRTITHAFYIELDDVVPPKVKGSDDAVSAEWIPLSSISTMRDKLFEDHMAIIQFFTGIY